MEYKWIIQGEKTIQVTECEWKRITETIKLNGGELFYQIIDRMKEKGVDMDTLRIHSIEPLFPEKTS